MYHDWTFRSHIVYTWNCLYKPEIVHACHCSRGTLPGHSVMWEAETGWIPEMVIADYEWFVIRVLNNVIIIIIIICTRVVPEGQYSTVHNVPCS